MNDIGQSEGPRPWYREFWPWALMIPPAFAVAGGVAMIVLANSTPSALVVDDYSRIEALTAERFERDRAASRLGLAAELSLSQAADGVELSLAAPADFELPRVLSLRLQHATDPDLDRTLRLVRYGERFAAPLGTVSGRYRIELEPEDGAWRLGSGLVDLDGQIRLAPQPGGG